MYKNTWKWQFVLIAVLGILLIWTSKANALDDFNVAKYGPNATVEIGRTDFIVKFKTYTDNATLNDTYREETGRMEDDIAGYSLSHPSYDVCEVHMVIPTLWDDREALTIMGHEILHCMLANHTDEDGNDLANSTIIEGSSTSSEEVSESNNTLQEIEDLYAEDRQLELEWLKEDYEKMGIVVDE